MAPPGRGVLSMQDLSHGVIRIDSEEKLSVLTLQDVGSVMPGGESGAADPQNGGRTMPERVHVSGCSSHVCGESRRTSAALQGRRDRRVGGLYCCHGNVLLRSPWHDEVHV